MTAPDEEVDDMFGPAMGWGAIIGWMVFLTLAALSLIAFEIRDSFRRRPS